jgi:hypothetical protein
MRRLPLTILAILLFVLIVGGAFYLAQLESLIRTATTPDETATGSGVLASTETNPPVAKAPAEMTVSPTPHSTLDNPLIVPFPEGAVDHSFFPLAGGHGGITCQSCHSQGIYQGTSVICLDCHLKDEPHQGTYGIDCTRCHVIAEWQSVNFDHTFMGSNDCATCHAPPPNHYAGACSACHVDTGNFHNVNFTHEGLTDCQGCHAPPPNHFPGQCSDCHNTSSFEGATFEHTFPLDHEDANGNCAACHPGGNTATYSCVGCHEQERMDDKHDEESGYRGNNCVDCHADGREHDDDD